MRVAALRPAAQLCSALRSRLELLSEPVGSKAKTFCPTRKALGAIFVSSFNVKMPSSYDKTAASTLVSVAAASVYNVFLLLLALVPPASSYLEGADWF